MTIPRNLSFLAEGASSTGVLGTANGGTGLNTLGAAGQALVVNSGATGLTYSTPSAGAMSLITSQVISGSPSNITFSNVITSTYTKYRIIAEGIYCSGGSNLLLQYTTGTSTVDTNNVYTTSNYAVHNSGTGSAFYSLNTNSPITNYAPLGSTIGTAAYVDLSISTYNNTSGGNYSITGNGLYMGNLTTNAVSGFSGVAYNGSSGLNATVTGLYFTLNSGTFSGGKISIYGIS